MNSIKNTFFSTDKKESKTAFNKALGAEFIYKAPFLKK